VLIDNPFNYILRPVANPFDGGSHNMSLFGLHRESDDDTSGVLPPKGREEATEAWNRVNISVIFYTVDQSVHFFKIFEIA
jgi:hypothetical protein